MSDFDQILLTASPLSVLAAVLTGLQAGAFYSFQQRLGVRAFHTMILLSMFFASLAIVALIERDGWQKWVGGWILGLLFAVGQRYGYALRERLEKRPRRTNVR